MSIYSKVLLPYFNSPVSRERRLLGSKHCAKSARLASPVRSSRHQPVNRDCAKWNISTEFEE